MSRITGDLVKNLADEAIKMQKLYCEKNDQEMIKTVKKSILTANDTTGLIEWMQSYKVLQRKNDAEVKMLLPPIMTQLNAPQKNGFKKDFLSLYEALENTASAYKEAAGKSRLQTRYYSLSTKVLWLKHPKEGIMYDRYVANALSVIVNSNNKNKQKRDKENNSFNRFWNDWHTAYESVEKTITEECTTSGYPYPKRIFDKILWLAGRPCF